jgi:hypothetical protein
VKRERGGSNGASPDRGQTPEHRFGVTQARECSEQAAETRQYRSFFQEHSPDLFRRESEREKSADFSRALFKAELKEQGHE